MRDRRRWLAVGAAAAVVAVGAGAALGAAGTGNPASSFLGDVAKKLGISESKLTDAIKAAQLDRIDAAVARGDLTKEQGEALKERVRSGQAPAILPGFRGLGPGLGLGHERGLGRHGGRFPFGLGAGGPDLLEAAADYLGMSEAQLREALAGGKTLGELAKDRGKSVDGLKQAIRKAIRADVDEAVQDGLLTKEQGDRLAEALAKAVDAFVDAGFPGRLGLGLPGLGLGPLFGHHGFKLGRGLGLGLGLGKASASEAAADYLGMTRAQLREALAGGKSLGELAKDRGKSVDGLKQAIRKAIRADVDKAVRDGVVTKAQGDALYAELAKGVDAFVDGKLGFRLDLRGGHGFRFDFHLEMGRDGPGARFDRDLPAPSAPASSAQVF